MARSRRNRSQALANAVEVRRCPGGQGGGYSCRPRRRGPFVVAADGKIVGRGHAGSIPDGLADFEVGEQDLISRVKFALHLVLFRLAMHFPSNAKRRRG